MTDEERKRLNKEIEQTLLEMFGAPILNLQQLAKALNYSSTAAIRQAILRKTFPIAHFKLHGRRGHFVLVTDVAAYLAGQAIEDKGGGKKK